MTHPNGFTTVYAHLLKAAPEIEKYIKAKHYELKSFEIDDLIDFKIVEMLMQTKDSLSKGDLNE